VGSVVSSHALMQTYLHAHLSLKEAALAKLKRYERRERNRFQPSERGPVQC
jgi:hypothetical protein